MRIIIFMMDRMMKVIVIIEVIMIINLIMNAVVEEGMKRNG